MNTIAPRLLCAVLVGWALCQTGCARSPGVGTTQATNAPRILSGTGAAELAARLANDECAEHYKRRPFAPGQYPAIRTNGIYQWGGLDVGGPAGFSALVTFRPDGSAPHVEVYFSSDMLGVQKVLQPERVPRDK